MRARDVLDALERIELFRSQAADSHRRVENIGGDLDSAISLLDLRQSREAVDAEDTTAGATQGANRVVLDWSTGVIAKLASALPKPGTASAPFRAGSEGIRGTADGSSERHARNAERWLADPRIWRAFARSLRGGTTRASEPSTHLPQSASLGVLRAAIFAVRAGAAGAEGSWRKGKNGGGGGAAEDVAADAVLTAGQWAFLAIVSLCGGVIVTAPSPEGRGDAIVEEGGGGRAGGGYSSGSMTKIDEGVLDELLPPQRAGVTTGTGGAPKRLGGGGALMKMSLDAYVTFLEEAIRGHVIASHALAIGPALGHRLGGLADGAAAGGCAPSSLAEGALTELLRFQMALQAQQTSPRKVFSTFCSKLMGPLFRILRPEVVITAGVAPGRSPLQAAARSLVRNAVFHEDHLEGYREAFTAAEAATAAAVGNGEAGSSKRPQSSGPGVETVVGSQPAAGEGGKKKRRRKNKGVEGGDNAGTGGSAGGKAPRRVCYQQQLLDEFAALAAGSLAGDGRSPRLGAMAGAPLLLEGFIVRLGKAQQQQQQQQQLGAADIHEVAGSSAVSSAGGKRSRSSGGGSGGGGGGGGSPSPASQMFRLWAVLTSTLSGSLESKSPSASSPQPVSASLPWVLVLRSYLLSSNSMLRLLAEHDVYRINEDWGGLEFDKLRGFSASLIRLAESDIAAAGGDDGGVAANGGPRSAGASMSVCGDERGGATSTADAAAAAAISPASREGNESGAGAGTGAAQEFLRAFSSLLGLNHNILHDDLTPVLRMTFEWAAASAASAASAAATTATDVKTNGSVMGSGNGWRRSSGGGGGGGDDVEVLRSLAIGLVVSLVDTYGRLRQMDHLVRALFGAIADRPEAAAALLRTDECTAALGRAFRRLPEGQIESMWDVFAAHLREGWNRGGTDVGRGELLAREVDAEMFVLFVRNLHVTSSVASPVGKLCTDLAHESLRSFGLPLQQAAAAAAAVAASGSTPSSSSKKKKKKKRKSGEHGGGGGGGGGGMTVEAMLSFRPALDVHGWLLDLDTRCRFWSAVLDSSPSGAPAPVTTATAAPPDAEGDTLVEEHDGEEGVAVGGGGSGDGASTAPPGSPATSGARASNGEGQEMTELPRVLAAAAAALGTGSSGGAAGAEGGAGADDTAGVRRRLEMTLQQVAVHRVQQIYARLNGVAALEGGAVAAEKEVPTGSGVEGEDESDGEGGGSKDRRRGEEARLEEEARDLVAFACRACGRTGAGSAGAGVSAGGWGDGDRECGGRGGGASWSMMMPYLPVWVGFAAREQVAFFLEALLSRCASDVLAGRDEEESPPLRLLSDASFYEMEAVAEAAPAVVLAKVYGTVKRATSTRSDTGGCRATSSVAPVGALSSVETLVAAVKALASESFSEAASSGSSGEEQKALEVDLLEACCLVMTTERFPPGFLDEEALAGLLTAADALDAVLTRCLLRGGGGGDEEEEGGGDDNPAGLVNVASVGLAVSSAAVRHRAALVEAVTALRRLALRLGRALTPESPLLGGLPHADALLRVIGPASGATSGGAESRSLLRASANLLPFLAERCVLKGDTKTALKAIVGLGLIKPRAAVSDIGKAAAAIAAGEKRRRQRGHPPLASAPSLPQSEEREGGREREDGASSGRLVLLHGVLSGFVAGESRRLAEHAAAAVAARAAASKLATTMNTAMDLDSDNSDGYDDDGYDDDGLGGVATTALERTHQQQQQQPQPQLSAALDQRLVATVSHLAGCLPAPGASASEPQPSPTAVPPPLLLVWSDALRLSFLGADAQRLVFSGRTPGGVVRSRSRWVEDCVAYLARRLESAGDGGGDAAAGRSVAGPAVTMPSERSACCHLIRAVCGCSHLLDPPLPRLSVRRLVEAFVGIVGVAAYGGGSGDGDYFDADGGARRVQRAEEDLVLHTAFCLLVQFASEAQLEEIVSTLLEMLGGGGGDARMAAAAATHAASLPYLGSLAARPTVVALLRLATRAGRGAAFKAVVPRHALSLANSLCRQLRGATDRGSGGGGRHDKKLGYWSTYGSSGSSSGGATSGATECDRLRNATGALAALEGLLDRQPYSSITARVVSVVLGSVEPAARAALDAMAMVDARGSSGGSRSSSSGNSSSGCGGGGGGVSSVVRESLVCFRACCRVVGTVLQHYARKVYSCTPPFASLCRSLLRLFFRLSSAPAPAASGAGAAARGGAPAGSSNARGERRRNPNATAPSAAASEAADADGSGSGSGGRLALSIEEQVAAASVFSRGVLEQFVPHKEVLKKYAAFLLLEYVSLSGLVALEPAPRAALLSGVFAVMQACSTREMRQLHRLLGALPTGTGQEVFRSLNEEYQRQHKYVGKM